MKKKLTIIIKMTDGCPDERSTELFTNNLMYDSDSDGILDKIDNCLTLPETYNNFEDEDGCPEYFSDYDSDNDGILDSVDDCKF